MVARKSHVTPVFFQYPFISFFWSSIPFGFALVLSFQKCCSDLCRPSSPCVLMFQVHECDKIVGCLNWLHQRAMCGPNRFKVCFLEDLSLELYGYVNKNMSESSVKNMLTTSAFDYEPNTRFSSHTVLWFCDI